jgi:hypothetical protein
MVTAIVSGFIGSRLGRRRTIRPGPGHVNSLPKVVDMTVAEKIGGYTGLYYLFSPAASIVAPPAAGALYATRGLSP